MAGPASKYSRSQRRKIKLKNNPKRKCHNSGR
jgi:hypothetical protein